MGFFLPLGACLSGLTPSGIQPFGAWASPSGAHYYYARFRALALDQFSELFSPSKFLPQLINFLRGFFVSHSITCQADMAVKLVEVDYDRSSIVSAGGPGADVVTEVAQTRPTTTTRALPGATTANRGTRRTWSPKVLKETAMVIVVTIVVVRRRTIATAQWLARAAGRNVLEVLVCTNIKAPAKDASSTGTGTWDFHGTKLANVLTKNGKIGREKRRKTLFMEVVPTMYPCLPQSLRNRLGTTARQSLRARQRAPPGPSLQCQAQGLCAAVLAAPSLRGRVTRDRRSRSKAPARAKSMDSRRARSSGRRRQSTEAEKKKVKDVEKKTEERNKKKALDPEMHFIMKTRRFAHFIMKTPAGKRPIPPKPMSTIGLTKPAHQQQFFHRAHTSIVQKILGFSRRFPGFSRRILGKFSGCFFSMFFTHKTVVNAPWASQHFENI